MKYIPMCIVIVLMNTSLLGKISRSRNMLQWTVADLPQMKTDVTHFVLRNKNIHVRTLSSRLIYTIEASSSRYDVYQTLEHFARIVTNFFFSDEDDWDCINTARAPFHYKDRLS